MKTQISEQYRGSAEGQEAEAILRSCVHCGFCTATCPTYQELCDERDGPRGRIYLIKQLLEGGEVTDRTRTHLDRCLTCRSCETTCPSGVKYGRLVDIGRGLMEQSLPRSPAQRAIRWALRQVLPYRNRFGPLLKLGQVMRPLLPSALKAKVPPTQSASPWPTRSHPRRMLALQGCAQPAATPNTLAATARVLDRLGISLVVAPEAGCCGAVSYHLAAHSEGLDFMRRNIDAWWPAVEAGAEAILITASGCGAMVEEYGHLLRDDPAYAEKARRISELCRDISQVLAAEDLSVLALKGGQERIAVHCPCTLQHALKQPQTVQKILRSVGFELTQTRDNHLCCGSAGTYSILQPEMSQTLLGNKLEALTMDNPDRIVTANVGCQLHLQSRAQQPVSHWIELLDQPG
ncbi:glycolate oxidase subunit GlcF [Aestuariirhabdus litorea]|uniref:Glycolate oxidase iron-sulfur subunit n=1 Tax=Aestuariirhabdus litorea TaxID=2528527 RepID=A0A3P3VNF0_9GAMM|nr:glycolate oxidase subunit GlcF [Aestuariirhabdus litorea]RRJ84282.1 glycolate oxidase iron-sulfur subunit [Aestuariirhabdus litorea]RWW97504.1 glycolate oxidase iron-sulfur subunit [Endozoicomonadaceae bacterium GTF-13]